MVIAWVEEHDLTCEDEFMIVSESKWEPAVNALPASGLKDGLLARPTATEGPPAPKADSRLSDPSPPPPPLPFEFRSMCDVCSKSCNTKYGYCNCAKDKSLPPGETLATFFFGGAIGVVVLAIYINLSP